MITQTIQTVAEEDSNMEECNKMNHMGHLLGIPMAIRPNKPFAIYGCSLKTGSQFTQRVASLTTGLQKLGLKKGDVIAICALNSDLYLEWFFAVTCAGCILAPLNHRWSFEEACYAAKKVDAVMVVVDSFCIKWCDDFAKNLPKLQFQVILGDQSQDTNTLLTSGEYITELGKDGKELSICWAPDSTALICFTSGTTGYPKGVAISHSALIVQSMAKISLIGYNSSDVYLHTSPLCHIGGISSALALVMAGGCHVFLPAFQTNAVVDSIKRFSVSAMISVPTMLADIVTYCRQSGSKDSGRDPVFESMKKILNGGGSLSLEVLRSVKEIFPTTKIYSAYGMTEACSSLTFMVIHDPMYKEAPQKTKQRFGIVMEDEELFQRSNVGIFVGDPAPHIEIKIEPNHEIFYNGEKYIAGNILTRGPHVMQKYWNQEKETLEAFIRDRWFNTNDMGWIDKEGKLWLLGRSKDMVKSGGENVYPSQVENIILKHPGVQRVVVFGAPDVRLNEVVTASIQLQSGWQWTEDNNTCYQQKTLSPRILQLFCKENGLSRFKVPRKFFLHKGTFPTTSTGKVRRDLVKVLIIDTIQQQLKPRNSNL